MPQPPTSSIRGRRVEVTAKRSAGWCLDPGHFIIVRAIDRESDHRQPVLAPYGEKPDRERSALKADPD